MSKTRENSMQYDMRRAAIQPGMTANTEKTYRREIGIFCEWAKQSEGVKTVSQLRSCGVIETVQKYADYLGDKYDSPWTIHTKLAAVCKGLSDARRAEKIDRGEQVDKRYTFTQQEITGKPQRTVDKITRGRVADANPQGRKEATQERYARVVEMAQCVGVRVSEAERFRGRDFRLDESGHWCMDVLRGKGGKHQLQRILPQDLPTVQRIMDGIPADGRVFTRSECGSHINVHGYRAEHAQRSYAYYAGLCSKPDSREQLRRELVARFDALHPRGKYPDARENAIRDSYIREVYSDKPYALRGANREFAIQHGLPVLYERTALLAVSVYSLSHWRCDVSVKDYMLVVEQ